MFMYVWQEVHALWEEVQKEVKLKTTRISELNVRLNECEGQRTDEVRLTFNFMYNTVLQLKSSEHWMFLIRCVNTSSPWLP